MNLALQIGLSFWAASTWS